MPPDLIGVLLPERCVVCGRGEQVLCAGCRRALPRLADPLCRRCGAPVAWPVERCRECAGRRLAFDSARAAVAYEGAAIALVSAWKERGRRNLAETAAAVVAESTGRPGADAITSVPAVRDRGLWRGHDPAERLAVALARSWRLPFRPLLVRTASPPRQRGRSARERARNVAGGFAARGAAPPSVLLVDDVYTTGSTLSAAAAALRERGASTVLALTFARALRGPRSAAVTRAGLRYDGDRSRDRPHPIRGEREEQGGSA